MSLNQARILSVLSHASMLLDNDSAHRQVSMPLTLVPASDFHPRVPWESSEPHVPRQYFAIVWLIQPKTVVRLCPPGGERDEALGVRLLSPVPDRG